MISSGDAELVCLLRGRIGHLQPYGIPPVHRLWGAQTASVDSAYHSMTEQLCGRHLVLR